MSIRLRTGYCGHSDHYPLCEKCQIEELESIRDELLEALEALLAVAVQYDLPLSDPERISARLAIAKARGEK